MPEPQGSPGKLDFDVDALRKKYTEERQKRLRPDANAQYQQLSGSFARLAEDPYVEPGFTRAPLAEEVEVLIVGGGLSGLVTAARLRGQGVESIRIVEKGGDYGGTWYWNRYPGAACDVESYVYMPLLEELGYVPSEKYAKAPEIYRHCRNIAKHYDLYRAALFQTSITALRWDSQRDRWIASTSRDDRLSARFAIIACGFLSMPKLPRIPGIESFAGHSFHTSRWDYDYTGGSNRGGLAKLADKRVGIIGTGATAIQCVPHLGEAAQQLYVFQRTPSSVDARGNRPTDPRWQSGLRPGWHKRRMENFNNICCGIAEEEDLVGDGWTDILRELNFVLSAAATAPDPHAVEIALFASMEKSRRRIDALVKDAATAETLKPYYNYLCKRPCFSDDYLQTFNRDNVTLVDTQGKGVERIMPHGVVVSGREYPLDCLIYATGYEFITELASQIGFEIHGRRGIPLSEKWSRGARTWHGLHTRDFPNLIILGFAQNGISVNFTHLIQERAAHVAYLIKRCKDANISTIEPSQAAEDEWVEKIIAGRGPRRAFLESCTPSYYNQEGKETPATSLNDIYAAGSAAFFKILEEWRTENTLRGLDVTVKEREAMTAS